MDPNAPAPTTPTAAEPAAPTNFLEAITLAQNTPAQPAEAAPAPAATPAPTSAAPVAATPGAPATSATEPNAHAWVQELGGAYKTPDEVKAALASLDTLRANQLNDDQRAVLKLAEDPAAWREFNELTHMGDLKELPDEEVLFRAFMRQRPGADPEDARFLFEQEQDTKYPGLAQEPTERAYKAHLAERKRDADAQRTTLTTQRDTRLAELKKGALPAAGPAKEQEEADKAAFLDSVDKLLGSHKEGYKLTVPVGDSTLNLAVEPKDLPAFKAILANPLGALLTEDGKALDPQKLMRFAAFQLHGNTLLADAYQAGQTGGGPQVSVAELHNAEGQPMNPAAGGDGSFLAALTKVPQPQQGKVKY